MIVVAYCYPMETAWTSPRIGVRMVRTPIGARSCEGLEDSPKPALLLSTGFGGGLQTDLAPGDLVLADCIHYDGEALPLLGQWVERARDALESAGRFVRVGPFVCVSEVADCDEKRRLGDSGGASVDMESGPLSRWASARGVPFLGLRAVFDRVDETIPFSASDTLMRTMRRHPLAVARAGVRAARVGRALGGGLDVVLRALEVDV